MFRMRERLRQADPRLITILLIVFVQFVGASMALPILPLYARRSFELDPNAITPILASFFAAQFIAGPFIGRLSDNYGRVPVLIVSQIGTVIAFLMLVFAQSVEMLYLSRILDGITGGNIVAAQAYVTDITPGERRTQALGLIFASFGLGFIVGPALGGVLSAFFGVRAPFMFAAFAASVVVLLTWRNLNESLTPEKRAENRASKGGRGLRPMQVITNSPLMVTLAITLIGQFGLGLLQATFSLYGEAVLFSDFSETIADLGIGAILAMVGLGQLITQTSLLGPMLERFGPARLVLIGISLRGTGFVVLALIASPFLAAPATLAFAIGSGLLLPSIQSLLTQTVDDSVRGGALGLFQSTTSLAIIFSTFLGGQIFGIMPSLPFWLAAGLAVLATIPAAYMVRWVNRQNAAQADEAEESVASAAD